MVLSKSLPYIKLRRIRMGRAPLLHLSLLIGRTRSSEAEILVLLSARCAMLLSQGAAAFGDGIHASVDPRTPERSGPPS